MGNAQSIVGDREPVVESAQPLQLLGRLSKHTHRCASRGQHIYRRPDRGEAERSSAINPWQHGFLDLPAAVRSQVYTYLFLVEDEIQITPSQVTKVPELILLQTCKQLHAEVAPFFYASNTFHCNVKKLIPTQKATEQPQYPSIRAPLDCRTLRDPLNITGGVFFPAPRYHQYLTHLTIHLDVTIAHFEIAPLGSSMPTFTKPDTEGGLTCTDMSKMHQTIEHKLLRVFRRIRELWQEKDEAWTGKLVIPERTSWTSALVYEMEFRIEDKN